MASHFELVASSEEHCQYDLLHGTHTDARTVAEYRSDHAYPLRGSRTVVPRHLRVGGVLYRYSQFIISGSTSHIFRYTIVISEPAAPATLAVKILSCNLKGRMSQKMDAEVLINVCLHKDAVTGNGSGMFASVAAFEDRHNLLTPVAVFAFIKAVDDPSALEHATTVRDMKAMAQFGELADTRAENVCFLMAYREYGDLFERTNDATSSRLSIPTLERHVGGAIEHLHDAYGLVHKDIKLENVFLTDRLDRHGRSIALVGDLMPGNTTLGYAPPTSADAARRGGCACAFYSMWTMLAIVMDPEHVPPILRGLSEIMEISRLDGMPSAIEQFAGRAELFMVDHELLCTLVTDLVYRVPACVEFTSDSPSLLLRRFFATDWNVVDRTLRRHSAETVDHFLQLCVDWFVDRMRATSRLHPYCGDSDEWAWCERSLRAAIRTDGHAGARAAYAPSGPSAE